MKVTPRKWFYCEHPTFIDNLFRASVHRNEIFEENVSILDYQHHEIPAIN